MTLGVFGLVNAGEHSGAVVSGQGAIPYRVADVPGRMAGDNVRYRLSVRPSADPMLQRARGDVHLGEVMMRRLCKAVDREERQNCKRQEGRYGGVQTHHDFGGAERQSIFYVKD
jgi:hypothetical protein